MSIHEKSRLVSLRSAFTDSQLDFPPPAYSATSFKALQTTCSCPHPQEGEIVYRKKSNLRGFLQSLRGKQLEIYQKPAPHCELEKQTSALTEQYKPLIEKDFSDIQSIFPKVKKAEAAFASGQLQQKDAMRVGITSLSDVLKTISVHLCRISDITATSSLCGKKGHALVNEESNQVYTIDYKKLGRFSNASKKLSDQINGVLKQVPTISDGSFLSSSEKTKLDLLLQRSKHIVSYVLSEIQGAAKSLESAKEPLQQVNFSAKNHILSQGYG